MNWLGSGLTTFIVSIFVIVIFAVYITAVTFFPSAVTLGKEEQGIIIGGMISAFMTVVNYYCGSSLGSANKSLALEQKK